MIEERPGAAGNDAPSLSGPESEEIAYPPSGLPRASTSHLYGRRRNMQVKTSISAGSGPLITNIG